MSEQQGGFFQFPLLLLATREPFEQWLPRIFHYGVVDFIKRTEEGGNDFGLLPHKRQTRAFERAKVAIGFSGGAIEHFVKEHRQAEILLQSSSIKTFSVRLKTPWYFETRDEGMLSEREFRVLIGIYSVIGPKPFAKIGWPMIQARAAGHLSVADPTKYQGPVYSRGQIERACAELLDRKFVASVTYNRGERFWTHRMSSEELADAVTAKKTSLIKARHARAALNGKLSAAIALAKQPLITCSPPARSESVPET